MIGLFALVLLSTRGESRRRAATWALALAGAVVYRLIHPVQHFYLIFPVILVGAVASAVPMAWIADRKAIAPTLRLIALLVLISEMSTGLPRFCNLSATLKALASLLRGQAMPSWSPPGSFAWFEPRLGRLYSWDDYRRVLIHLRSATGPTTLVANVLNEPPFPSINGPAARLSPFRAESGICWMWLVDIDLEPEFAAALEQATDVVVVWAPPRTSPRETEARRLTAVIREHYRPEARFGNLEVWPPRGGIAVKKGRGPGEASVTAKNHRLPVRKRW